MNGIVASLIVSGDTATAKDITALNKKLAPLANTYAAEVIVYFSKQPQSLHNKKNLVFTSSKTIPGLQKAVVVSSGEVLIFSTLRNFLADKKNVMLNQALNAPIEAMAIPLSKGVLGKVGFSKTFRIPFIAIKRDLVLQIAGQCESLPDILAHAEKHRASVQILPDSGRLPDYTTRSQPLWQANPGAPAKQTATPKLNPEPIHYSPDIPTFIICRDRFEPLKKLIKWCEAEGLTNLILLDNASTYPPLVKYLVSTKHEVVRLNHNVGYLSPWMTGAINIYAKDRPYIVSDADVIPQTGAHGAIKLFCKLLNDHPKYLKAGFGLKIDDLPDSYEPKDYVIAWEKKFWQKKVEKDVYDADIDTTFALWRPNLAHTYGPSLRTGGKYVAQHDTWYIDSKKPSAEMRYYYEHGDKVTSTWVAQSSEVAELYHKNKKST